MSENKLKLDAMHPKTDKDTIGLRAFPNLFLKVAVVADRKLLMGGNISLVLIWRLAAG